MSNVLDAFEVYVRWNGDSATVTPVGELDFTETFRLAPSIDKVLSSSPQQVILDLEHLLFLDVAGARELAFCYQKIQAQCPVVIRKARPMILKVLGLVSPGWAA